MGMDVNRMCMGCMAAEMPPRGPCSQCGFQEEAYIPQPHILPLRTILSGKYLVGRMIGQGGFGIIYLGWDLNLDMKLAIKEYYPNGFVIRDCHTSTTLTPYTGEYEVFFRKGLEKFVDEAKRLAKFYSLPGIVSVRDYFQENGTAYIVMEFIEGQDLKAYLEQRGGSLSLEETLNMMRPLMESLAVVHQSGIIHRDISPDNIMIDGQGRIHLLDFGAAREFGKKESQTILLKHGYAPYEQYLSNSKQGPWTDIYALSATIYHCITGQIPEEAPRRVPTDHLQKPSALGVKLSRDQEAALMKGLAFLSEDRWQSISEMARALYENEPDPDPDPNNLDSFIQKLIQWWKKLPAKGRRGVIGGCVGALALVVLLPMIWGRTGSPDLVQQSSNTSSHPDISSVSHSVSSSSHSLAVPPMEQWGQQSSTQSTASGTAQLRQPEDPNAVVTFSDWAMEYHIRNALEKPQGDITAGELAQIEQLHICDIVSTVNAPPPDFSGRTSKMSDGSPVPHLTTLEDLRYFINLKELTLYNQDFNDISPIAQLMGLIHLNLTGNEIFDFTPLSHLKNLECLNLESMIRWCLSDLSFLSELTGLRELYLDDNRRLTDLSPLKNLTGLETLSMEYVGQQALEDTEEYLDISFLSQLTQMKSLTLKNCKIYDLMALTRMSCLEELDITSTPVSDLSLLIDFSQLKIFRYSPGYYDSYESRRVVTDLSPLSGLLQLTELELDDLSAPELSALEGLTNLEKLSVTHSEITDLSALKGLTNLVELDVEDNDITDLSPLAGKKKLEKLWIRKNPISDLSPLRSNENLIYLRVKLFDSDQCLVTDWTPVEHVETVVGRPE